jgi:hypothetical protein
VKALALQSRMSEKGQARPSLMWAKVPVRLSRRSVRVLATPSARSARVPDLQLPT